MRPPLKDFGGEPNFHLYRSYFRSLYSDRTQPFVDVMGRTVYFDQENLDDAAHVCYGGLPGQPYSADEWKEDRAQRISWIGLALTKPNKIHPDQNDKNKQKYLLFVGADDNLEDDHWFCVIVRKISETKVSFLTAFPVSKDRYYLYGNVPPRVWPLKDPKKKNKRHK